MIIPNYTNYKSGLCTDMEFFKFSYAGKKGQVLKRYVKALGRGHPFYIIKRPLNDQNTFFEFKVYDFFHDGFVEKEQIREDKENDVEIPSLTSWWLRILRTNHMKEYILFCKDTNQY